MLNMKTLEPYYFRTADFVIYSIIFFVEDIPIGLLNDIYDYIRKFGERLDEIEDVTNENRLFKARTKDIGVITTEQALNLGLT